ncbi:MAG: SCP2 sterol-binding domain-containing protein [Xanthomonadaceae bacterium]|jgi:ubiquinone biosynthesis protein UbiJ|nr:SCP2 sterol-binding domain-containing protein [Xanthomonadaceae bacterium]
MSSSLHVLKPLAGRALETALNRALALDPETRKAMLALDGRRIMLTVQSPPLALELRVSGDRLQVGPAQEESEGEADLAIRSTLGGLLAQLPFFAQAGDRAAAPGPGGRMRVSGDAELARHLQGLASRFDPDWQQPFTSVFGDVVGTQIANAVRSALGRVRAGADGFARSAAEYVTEESRDVVGRAELEAFYEDVDNLRDAIERMEVRVSRLRRTAEGAV